MNIYCLSLDFYKKKALGLTKAFFFLICSYFFVVPPLPPIDSLISVSAFKFWNL